MSYLLFSPFSRTLSPKTRKSLLDINMGHLGPSGDPRLMSHQPLATQVLWHWLSSADEVRREAVPCHQPQPSGSLGNHPPRPGSRLPNLSVPETSSLLCFHISSTARHAAYRTHSFQIHLPAPHCSRPWGRGSSVNTRQRSCCVELSGRDK